LFSEALRAVEPPVETQEGEEVISRVPTFIACEGIHIALIAEAYKLHVQMPAEEVNDRADVNKGGDSTLGRFERLWRDGGSTA
jgi:hypothetical protein